jgi:hypothetical protein
LPSTLVLLTAMPLHAQSSSSPESARIQAGPLAVAPSIRVTNFGYDSNVLGRSESEDPQSDLIATFSPAADWWVRLPGGRVTARSGFDFIYYNQLAEYRSLDIYNSVDLTFDLKLVRPYVRSHLFNTRHGFNYEFDAPTQRRDYATLVGAELRLTGKSSIDVRSARSRTEYAVDETYFESDLSRLLNRRSSYAGAAFRYGLTPLTTFAVDVDRLRDRFDSTPERDAERVRLSSIVEFQPGALLSGRFQFGMHERTFVSRSLPPFKGSFMALDLNYTLLGRTHFEVHGHRGLEYSYREREEEYQVTAFDFSVVHQLADPWHVRARFGRDHLVYLDPSSESGPSLTPDSLRERRLTYGVELGYKVGRTRLAFRVTRIQRRADTPDRNNDRLRVGTSLAYVFD